MKTLSFLILSFALSLGVSAAESFSLKSGDRVVFLGDTLIERENAHGYLETALTIAFPESKATFRNLGWSADRVDGESRASFDHLRPEKGWPHLLRHVREAEPTVVFLGYGMAHSFDGAVGLEAFRADYERLIESLRKEIGDELRFVFLSPIPHERKPSPLPDPDSHNRQLAAYTRVIRDVASKFDSPFVDLYDGLSPRRYGAGLTDNGIHLNESGYWAMAREVCRQLEIEFPSWDVSIDTRGGMRRIENGRLATRSGGGAELAAGFAFEPDGLPFPNHPNAGASSKTEDSFLNVQIEHLDDGNYELVVDGETIRAGTSEDWTRGFPLYEGPIASRLDSLRSEINAKNELFFHRWRPQNSTYLFLFRKHEQGQNAVEIPQFDGLIAGKESAIRELLAPEPANYELKRVASLKRPRPPEPEGAILSQFGQPVQDLPQFTTGEGIEISLWAENPLLAKPIHMNFDDLGRLWVASSATYPQIAPGDEAGDQILVIEDINQDGVADRSTVFAEGLLIPTGVVPGDDGVYVGQSTELLHFRDTDGDGRADERRTILSGFGTEDTHHILHSLDWGPEGRLYMNQSIYIHSHIETPHGVLRQNSGGILALDTKTMKIETFLNGFCNPWGHQIDAFGQSFVTDGAGFQGISHGVTGAMYFTYAGAPRILDSISPGRYPKFCGLEQIRSPLFPEDWQGDFITADFRAHRIVRFDVQEQGSSYVTQEMPDVVRTTDSTFRPIDIKAGRDGALYIADWSNPIIQHGEVDFRDPRRDHIHGRIWRIRHTDGAASVPRVTLFRMENSRLLDNLIGDDKFRANQSRRLLIDRGTAILDDVSAWAAEGGDQAKLEALWLFAALNRASADLLSDVLQSEDGRIRAAGVRHVSREHGRFRNASSMLNELVVDEHPRVRLEAVRALAAIGGWRSLSAAFRVLDLEMDPTLDYALWLTVNDLAEEWIGAIEAGDWPVDENLPALEFGLNSVQPALATRALTVIFKDRELRRDEQPGWIDLIGRAGGKSEIEKLFDRVVTGGFDTSVSVRALNALEEAARLRNVRPANAPERVSALIDSSETDVRVAALKLAGTLQIANLDAGAISKLAGDTQAPGALRDAAFEMLKAMDRSQAVAAISTLAAAEQPVGTRLKAVQSLAQVDLGAASTAAVDLLRAIEDEPSALALWRSMLRQRGGAEAMLAVLPRFGLSELAGRSGLRVAREGGRNEPELVFALSQSANLEAAERKLTPDELRELAARVERDGDPVRGEMVYRRPEIACVACHAIGGIGGTVGPDMTSIGASAQTDYLIESLLFPNAKIKEGYHAIELTTDEIALAGVLVREDTNQLVVRDAAGQEVSVPRSDVVTQKMSDYSLMPSGLLDVLQPREKLDLYAFLSRLGEQGPFDASKPTVARLWHLMPETLDVAQFGNEHVLKSDLAEPLSRTGGWLQATSLIDGRLLKQDLETTLNRISWREPNAIFAAVTFQVARPGTVKFELDAPAEATLWIGMEKREIASNFTAEFEAGVHRLTLRIPRDVLPDSVRLASPAVTFLTH